MKITLALDVYGTLVDPYGMAKHLATSFRLFAFSNGKRSENLLSLALLSLKSGRDRLGFQSCRQSRKQPSMTTYNYADVHSNKMFYREAGEKNAPTIVLLHGFPSSSHMYRNLIPQLADAFHVIALDYVGFGYSDARNAADFASHPVPVGKERSVLHRRGGKSISA
jgi:alpha/beta hydrolase family protein